MEGWHPWSPGLPHYPVWSALGQGGVRAGALQLKFKCLSSRPALPLNETHDLSKLKSLSSRFLVYTIGRMTVPLIIVRIK